jgi:RNA polymerase subunit RPABC4/transcription elongation factor Spt4
MPPCKSCPLCTGFLEDWHLEWHLDTAMREIVAGRAARRCPVCHGAVLSDGWDVAPAPRGTVVLERDVSKAAAWARTQSQQRSLEQYLQCPQGLPFARYWKSVEVQDADNQEAQTP